MASTHDSSGAQRPSALSGAIALILDDHLATAVALREHLEDRGCARVELAETTDEALDVLGRAARPIKLAMLDTTTDGGGCAEVLRILRQHGARVHVTLHGRWPPEPRVAPRHLVGAGAYINHPAGTAAVRAAETVVERELTVRRILDDRVVPETLDGGVAIAIYGAGPGRPFPAMLRP